MNKQIRILLILVIVAAAVYFTFTRKPWRSFSTADSDFSISDTAAVAKIFLADSREGKVLLQQQDDGSWLVDGKFPADERKIALLLQTMHDMKMRNPIGRSEHNTVIRELTAAGIKTEFYAGNGDLIKTIYVGQMTNDQSGTYMMVDGADEPFVVHIPGFIGYLTPRFFTNPVKWKDKLVFSTKPEDVAEISVQYPMTPAESFTVDGRGVAPVVKDAAGNQIAADSNFVKYYLAAFNGLYAEAYDDNFTASQQDSINASDAFCIISLKTKKGTEQSLKLHIKGVDKRTKQRYDEAGNELTYDTEKYFGFANGDKNMMYIQQFNFGRIIRKASEFRKSGQIKA